MRSGVLPSLPAVARCARTTAAGRPGPSSRGDILNDLAKKPAGHGVWIREIHPCPFPGKPPPGWSADFRPHYR